MEECAVLDLDDTTKRLQQAYSKANHKARRNRGDATRIRQKPRTHYRIERSRRGSFYDPESVSDSLIALQRQLVSDGDGEVHRMELRSSYGGEHTGRRQRARMGHRRKFC